MIIYESPHFRNHHSTHLLLFTKHIISNGGPGGGFKKTKTFGCKNRASKKKILSCEMKTIKSSNTSSDWSDEEFEKVDTQQTNS